MERAQHLAQQAAARLKQQEQAQADGVLAEGAQKMKRRKRG